MNNLDRQYTDLLQDILDNGVKKETRNGETLSVFGRTIRYKFKDGKFPLLTTKKIPFKTMVTELLWFLKGDTNIKYLVDNDCHIWDGDAYKFFKNSFPMKKSNPPKDYINENGQLLTQNEFINKIKTDENFCNKFGNLGPIYGKQWRNWRGQDGMIGEKDENGTRIITWNQIDQIANLINDLKTNPDSRRLMVNSWNVGSLQDMVLPPCHYGFQVYTRELSLEERRKLANYDSVFVSPIQVESWDRNNIPTRAISLMWNQRSVDSFLGLPFNIASYGLLLMMIADEVNMVPDELIGNLGDTHLYLNHIEQAKEQIGRELTLEERRDLVSPEMFSQIYTAGDSSTLSHSEIDLWCIPRRTREPFELPTVHVRDGIFCSSVNDVILENYKSHPTIKAPLSN